MVTGGEAVLEAIRKAGQELGRAPSRAELKRLTGVSHFVVLKHFPTLRHAVEAAGFTPHIKGRRGDDGGTARGLRKSSGATGEKAVAGGVRAGGQVQRRDVYTAVWRMGGGGGGMGKVAGIAGI